MKQPNEERARQAYARESSRSADSASKGSTGGVSLRKVAKFLFLVGKTESEKILNHLPQAEAQELRRLIGEVTAVDPVEAEALMREFGGMLTSSEGRGGKDFARSVLEKAFGEEKASRLLQRAMPEAKPKPFEFLHDWDWQRLGLLLAGESNLVLSIVLPFLPPKTAADFIAHLEEGSRLEVIRRMSQARPVGREVLERVELALRDKARSLGEQQELFIDGKARLEEIVKALSPQAAERLLSDLEETDPELAQSLRNRLFTHDHLLRLRDLDLEAFLRTIEDEDLALVLQALPETTAQKIRQNLSERRRQWIEEEIQLAGRPAKVELDAALRDFLKKVRQAIEQGDLRYEDVEEYL